MVDGSGMLRPFRFGSVGRPRRHALAALVAAAERALAFPTLNALYAKVHESAQPATFCEKALAVLNVSYTVSPDDRRRIAPTGPLVVVANHPYGGLDGLILTAILQSVRPDVKLLANYLLSRIPELRETSLLVDPFDGPRAASRNRAAIRAAIQWLASGGVLGVFPAGEVSHLTLSNRCVTDPAWRDTIARIVRRTNAPVLSVFFEGCNSRAFQLLGLVHPRLRTVMLPHELLGKRWHTVHLRVGNLIPHSRLERFGTPAELTEYLRLRTYILKGRPAAADETPASCAPRASGGGSGVPIVAPQPAGEVATEIAALPAEQWLLRSGPFNVLYARTLQIPAALREIGRLRELTFRQVGEGTGHAIDLDRFDEYYLHLFVWNRDRQQLVGAYRLGPTDEILRRFGVRGLYTSTLFHYKPHLLEQISPALELGRSFVTAEYQRSYSPLMLLWKGLGRLLAAQPRYRRFFGAVSISHDYQSMTKQLLMAFLRLNNFKSELEGLVRPKNPPRKTHFRDFGEKLVGSVVRDLDEVDELVQEIEAHRKSMPVLLRQYLKLNAKLLGFNIDPSFGDVLDGLVLVDLVNVDRTILDRYLGAENAARFLAYHGVVG